MAVESSCVDVEGRREKACCGDMPTPVGAERAILDATGQS